MEQTPAPINGRNLNVCASAVVGALFIIDFTIWRTINFYVGIFKAFNLFAIIITSMFLFQCLVIISFTVF